jgi:hypothetical protein
MPSKKERSSKKAKTNPPAKEPVQNKPDSNGVTEEQVSRLMNALGRLELILNRYRLEQFYEVEQFKKTPYKMIWINLVLGVARGVGFILGLSFIGAVVISILASILSGMLEIPVIGQFVAEIIKSAEQYLKNTNP